jgi:hypothetical protein
VFGRVCRGAGLAENALLAVSRLCPSASLVVPGSHKALPGLAVRRSPFAARRADWSLPMYHVALPFTQVGRLAPREAVGAKNG